MNNLPQWPNDPNDPHAQDTVAGQYPQWGQPSYPQQAPPPQYSQPGQFGPPPNPQQLMAKPPLRLRFRAMPRWKRFGTIGCSTIIGAIMVCSLCAIVGNALPKAPQPSETTIASAPTHQTVQRAPTTKPKLKPTQKPKPTPTATPMPTPSPTATSSPTPTPTPTPMPAPPVQQQAPAQQPPAPATQPPPAQQAPVQPTPTPPPPAAPAQLFVNFTGASAVDNSSGSVSVHTLAGAALTISVKYCSGSYATSNSLKGTVNADAAGNYTWNWTPSTKCKGTATAYVTASLNGQSASNSTDFNVS